VRKLRDLLKINDSSMPKANRLINWIKMSHYYWCSQHGYGFFHFCQTLMNLYAITSHIDIGVYPEVQKHTNPVNV
jgi:hypothetical protein